MIRRILLLAALVFTLSCNHSSPTAPPPPPPGHSAATRLEILGNISLTAAGQTSQLTAKASFADGTTQDVTTTGTRWEGSSNTNVGSVSPSGLFTAVGLGEVSVSASYGSQFAYVSVLILPSGTFKLSGYVYESGGIQLCGDRVEILDGPSAGQSYSGCGYRFYGVSGDLHVRASKEGYQAETKSISMTGHQTLDFTLAPLIPPTSVAGRYTLTLTASSSCTQLPKDAMTRTYIATVDQDGARVRVTLTGATFLHEYDSPGNQFSGEIHGNAITFGFGGNDEEGQYDFLEQLSPSTRLSVTGTAVGVTTPAGMTLQLTGALTINYGALPSCTATDHQLVFSPSATTTSQRYRR
jgi:hypothetical protein